MRFWKLFFVLFCANYCSAQSTSADSVRIVFQNYKTALLMDDVKSMAAAIDHRTITFYSQLLNHALYSDSATVGALSPFEKINILSSRFSAKPHQLEGMSGSDYLEYTFSTLPVDKDKFSTLLIGEVNVTGNFASMALTRPGQTAILWMHFYNEKGIWKMNLSDFFKLINAPLRNMIKEYGLDENEFILKALEENYGRRPSLIVWKPLL